MLKNKSFLKGLGWGFIAGAVLLQMMITVKDAGGTAEPGAKEPELTAKLVKEKAAALHLKVYDADEKVYTQGELDDTVNKAVEKAKADAAAAGGTPPAAAPKQVTVYIVEGMPAVAVVDLLYKTGIVVDRMALEQTINSGQLSGKIRAGLYTFGLNEKIEDVIAKLTTPP